MEVYEVAQRTSDVSELQKIVKLLKSNLEKMVNGSKNLDLIFGSQRPYFEKIRLRCETKEDEKSSKDSQSKISSCIYCFKKSHSSKKYFSRKKAKRQKVKKLRKTTNPKELQKIWVPNVKAISDAGVP